VPGDELIGPEQAGGTGEGEAGSPAPDATGDQASATAASPASAGPASTSPASTGTTEAATAPGAAGPRAAEPARPSTIRRRLTPPVLTWVGIFAVSFGAFMIRFLVPVPVAQADNKDGPRLMCGLGLAPVTHGHARFFRFAYFVYVHSPSCGSRAPYPSSQLVLLIAAKLLTPLLGLHGSLNMLALGALTCVVASVAIASLAVGLRVRLWAQILVAVIIWVIVADSAFFDVFAGPFSEPAALIGLLLIAAGVLYLGRGWRLTVFGLVLAGCGGALSILSKEQYLVFAAPVCLTLVLATAAPGRWYRLRRFWTNEAQAAWAVALILVVMTGAYIGVDFTSHYGKRLHYIQAVDMIFTDIVTKRADAPAQLRDLGLPVSWAKYAGDYYWDTVSVRDSPLFPRYEDKLTDSNIAKYLITHPASIVRIGQNAAIQAQKVRVTALGTYAVSAGHKPGAYESRVIVFTSLMHLLPGNAGLLFYVPLWIIMAAIAIMALAWSRRRPWNRDGAVLVLCMTGCAIMSFIPPAYFAGISTTRHMVGMNLATAIALTISVGLAVSMIRQAARRRVQPSQAGPVPVVPELTRRTS
jgi:hypothetical protein